jgi:hypothetical protein
MWFLVFNDKSKRLEERYDWTPFKSPVRKYAFIIKLSQVILPVTVEQVFEFYKIRQESSPASLVGDLALLF